ncbi:hypothetical protein QF044_000589 [Chryseobacterium sp. W4I1]|nr:hypothetical protein [Chryseobacterium sp. W4I1]
MHGSIYVENLILSRASDSRIFLTFTGLIFLTLHFPKSGISNSFKLYNKAIVLNLVFFVIARSIAPKQSLYSLFFRSLDHCFAIHFAKYSLLFFCLETKEPKVQDWETSAKNKSCSLKILKLVR